jgi:hypothetical protein
MIHLSTEVVEVDSIVVARFLLSRRIGVQPTDDDSLQMPTDGVNTTTGQ